MAGRSDIETVRIKIPASGDRSWTEVFGFSQDMHGVSFLAPLQDLDITASALLLSSLLAILAVVLLSLHMRARKAGTQKVFTTFQATGRRKVVRKRDRVQTDFRALRKSRREVCRPDATKEIYVPQPSPGSTTHPSGPDPTGLHDSPQPPERPLSI